jgi:hypothetical protein
MSMPGKRHVQIQWRRTNDGGLQMKSPVQYLLASLLIATTLGTATMPAPVQAEEHSCHGTLGAITVDNLRVPQNAICVLNGTFVEGSVKVEQNATLEANQVWVVGNVQAENARNIVVNHSSWVGGSVQIKQGGGASVLSSHVTGDIQYDHNRSYLRANNNRVDGSIQVLGNAGGAEIFSNIVNGNLQCKENHLAPTGGGNFVGGTKEDQCASL